MSDYASDSDLSKSYFPPNNAYFTLFNTLNFTTILPKLAHTERMRI